MRCYLLFNVFIHLRETETERMGRGAAEGEVNSPLRRGLGVDSRPGP